MRGDGTGAPKWFAKRAPRWFARLGRLRAVDLAQLTPPEWLRAGLRPRDTPVPRAAAVRASVSLAAPLAAGFATGRPADGALVSMGALIAVVGDTADAYRMRILNLAVPQLFGAVGVTLGTLVFDKGWLAVGVLTVVALVSGMISSIGAVASSAGLLLLLDAVIGAGLRLPHPWWVPALLLSAGGLFVLLLSLLAWPLRGRDPERAAVAATYRAAADMLAAAGTPGYEDKRHATTEALNLSYDLVLARRARDHGRNQPLARLLAQLNVVIPLVEAAPVAHLSGERLRPEIPAAVRDLADVVAPPGGSRGPRAWHRLLRTVRRARRPVSGLRHRPGAPTPGMAPGQARGRDQAPRHGPGREPKPGLLDLGLPAPTTPSERAVDGALRHAVSVVRGTDPEGADLRDRLGHPAALPARARRAARTVLLSEASWRYGLRLALCIGLAQSLVSLIAVPRSYWVALTVTFVLKPDFGSVFSRAVLRALGTAVGLVIAAALLAAVPRGWGDVPIMIVLAGLIPALSVKGYAFQTAAITPTILLISDNINHLGFELVLPRFEDSLIGCAIVLVAGYLLWPESWHSRVGFRLAGAVAETADYVACAFDATPEADPTVSARARRRIYRNLSVVRSEFQRALTEPPPTGTVAAGWWPLVIAVERIVDATTAARVRVSHGAPPPAPAEVSAVERQLRALEDGVRSSTTLLKVTADLEGDEDDVLGPVRQEVRAARAIASTGTGRGRGGGRDGGQDSGRDGGQDGGRDGGQDGGQRADRPPE